MKAFCATVSLLLLSSAALAEGGDGDIESGAGLYDEFCSECHGSDVDGLSQFADTFPEFVSRLEGETDNMPDFTDFFDPDEVSDMFSFLQAVVSDEVLVE